MRNTMKKELIFFTSLFISVLISLNSCIKDDNDDLRAHEVRLLDAYLMENNITQDPTPSGLYHIPIVEGTGPKPVLGDWAEIQYVGELIAGSIFSTTFDSVALMNNFYDEEILYGPIRVQVGNINIEGISEGLQYMNEGGKSKLIIPSSLGLGSASVNGVPAYSTLIYTIDLQKTITDFPEYESELIQQFLSDSNFTSDSTLTGLYYIEQVEGTGEYIRDGNWVDVWYKGYFLDGRVFDSNIGGDVFSVQVPQSAVIDGWHEGLRLMRNGSKGTMIIPYDLAYGAWGNYDDFGRLKIPPYMTLVFEMEIDSIY
jgi:FKBP-type peptidyl-prolyl cis-trans isomerase FkpA